MAPPAAVSVIVPTYEEAMNIKPLCTRLDAAFKKAGYNYELLIMDDDSGKGTKDTIEVVKSLENIYPIRIHVRKRHEGKGLSSAVVLGFSLAKYDTFLVMDADLQHEPEIAPSIAKPIIDGKADFSIGSRNAEGGKVEDWPLHRKIISSGATALALPLASCSDPMSGFFSLKRETLKRAKTINPMGYKIGLELMVRCGCKNVHEVPFTFRDRTAGESKLTMKQNLLYVRHLMHLYWFKFQFIILVALFVLAALIVAMLR
jgi:dolichol-phosphate mannosyltransferase